MRQTRTVFIVATFFAISFSYAVDREMKTYDHILFEKIASTGLSLESFNYALNGYNRICDSLQTNFRYLFIADFLKPSSEKRLYVIDMQDSSLFHSDFVAHGRNSGELYAESFSNTMHSYQSSLGFYLISECYDGKHGLSIRLDGLDKGFNDCARERAIVMHAADYAEPSFIATGGRLGRSQGCPALPHSGFAKVTSCFKEKSLLFIYYPEKNYLSQSVWLSKQNQMYALPIAEKP